MVSVGVLGCVLTLLHACHSVPRDCDRSMSFYVNASNDDQSIRCRQLSPLNLKEAHPQLHHLCRRIACLQFGSWVRTQVACRLDGTQSPELL
jgi:hypothetical protein